MEQAPLTDVLISAELFDQNFQLVAQTFNAVQTAVVVLDCQGKIIYCNQHSERVLGYGLAKLRGCYFRDFLAIPAEAQQADQIWTLPHAEQFPCERTWSWRKSDGSSSRFTWSQTAILDPDGQVEYGVATGTPVMLPADPILTGHQSVEQRSLSWVQATLESVADQDATALLQQPTTQMAIAIQQSELYQQVQQLNVELEGQVQERTEQLQQALHFETILKRITDKVRDSLDECQILQTAVQEVGAALSVECCDTGIYNDDYTSSTVCYEYTALEPAQGKSSRIQNSNPIYRNLLQGNYVQFCELSSASVRNLVKRFAILACPIFDNQGVLGDLWLFKPREANFNDLEIRLVQQVANQCAIAIRQARLYQAAQVQVKELEKLNRLKDDFLSTISHELRTPVTSMRMALQMLGVSLNQELGLFAEFAKPRSSQNRTARYFQILREECEREIRLINDLLDLQRLDAEPEPPIQALIQLQDWLPSIVQPFYERTSNQQQILEVVLPENLPPLRSAPNHLERVLTELLDNACKYTPAKQQIKLQATVVAGWMHFQVTNTGVEIQESEIAHIFDQFYRIPSNDPWKQGGTGLGLALVSKLVQHLGGRVQAQSSQGQTSFTVQLPIAPA